MNSNFININHISFIVVDLAVAKHFYCDVMGLEIDKTRPQMHFDGLWLHINENQQIHLLVVDNPDPKKRPKHGGRDRHAAFNIRNLTKIITRLEAYKIPYSMSKSGREALFCRDPDGNTLELIV